MWKKQPKKSIKDEVNNKKKKQETKEQTKSKQEKNNKSTIKRTITEKQKLFALEFSKDLNATRAYKEVYKVSQSTAETNGPRLLGNAWVMDYAGKAIKWRCEKIEIDAEWVLSNLKEIVDICMQRKKIKKQKLVANVVEDWKIHKERQTVEEYADYDPTWANSALDKLGKYLKMFTNKHEVELTDVKDLLDDIIK